MKKTTVKVIEVLQNVQSLGVLNSTDTLQIPVIMLKNVKVMFEYNVYSVKRLPHHHSNIYGKNGSQSRVCKSDLFHFISTYISV